MVIMYLDFPAFLALYMIVMVLEQLLMKIALLSKTVTKTIVRIPIQIDQFVCCTWLYRDSTNSFK